MGVYSIKSKFQKVLRPAETFLVKHRVHPDTITLSALALSALGGVALAFSGTYTGLLLLIPVVAIGRTVLNALDGMVAIKAKLARPFGEVLNEYSDRIADAALFAGIACSGFVNPHLGWLTVVLALLSEDLGVLSKAAGGPRQYGGVMGKADRMIYLSIVSVVIYVGPFLPFTSPTFVWPAVVWPVFTVLVAVGCLSTINTRWRKTHATV